MPPPRIVPATPCFPACPSNHPAIGAVDMWIKLLQYLYTLRYFKNSVWCSKGYIENKNKIIAYWQFRDWYRLNTRLFTQKKKFIMSYMSMTIYIFLFIIVGIACIIFVSLYYIFALTKTIKGNKSKMIMYASAGNRTSDTLLSNVSL